MGLLDSIRRILTGGSTARPGAAGGGGSSAFGDDNRAYWVYVKCQRCGEPLKTRVDLMNEPSQDDEGGWIVRKGLTGSGKAYCFQTVEVTLRFDAKKQTVLGSEATGGTVLTVDEYHQLVAERERAESEATGETPNEA